MPNFDPQRAIGVLQANRAALGANPAEQEIYLTQAISRLASVEDKREATKLAVETAKMFLTIAIAVLVATGPWVQYLHTGGVPWASTTMSAFYVAALLMVVSMVFGFVVISNVYKRADGRLGPVDPAWSTEPVRNQLNGQAWSGMVALLALFVGLLLWATKEDTQKVALSITIPAATTGLPSSGPLMIEGDWNDLKIKTSALQEITLPAGKQRFSLMCQ